MESDYDNEIQRPHIYEGGMNNINHAHNHTDSSQFVATQTLHFYILHINVYYDSNPNSYKDIYR